MSDRFEKELRDHLHTEAEQTREFPRRLRGRIREGITPGRRARLVPQLAVAGALVLVAFAVFMVRSPQLIVNDLTSTIQHIVQPSPSPTPQPFLCTDRSGGTTGLSGQLTGIRVAHHSETPGFDRIVFDFSGGIPSYDLTRQEGTTFVKDPSGQFIHLDGSAGIKLVFRDTNIEGVAADQKPALPQLREIAQLGNFERVLSIGMGLSSSQCVRVMELSDPSRLVVDVITAPSATASAPPTPLPTASTSTNLGPFACQDFSGGTTGGMPMQLTAVRVAHQSAG
ncbi:MAG TPA: hypothetical protein VFR68_06830, partial [Candidatus Dormibacteraeota bacterium]|nr:hypothetical protein [Candidatus Dormibacteraeota bacterium]